MPDILHRVGIKAAANDVYKVLTTRDGLAGWWTADTRGDGRIGSVLQFRFDPRGFFDMRVLSSEPARHVAWEVIDGPAEWIGTEVSFALQVDGEWTIVLFAHRGWKEPVEFMHHCGTKWAIFLMSLKSLAETGIGKPYPDDVKIDNWN
jgi:uncharacterized protein YndB with AHSA1/START domain